MAAKSTGNHADDTEDTTSESPEVADANAKTADATSQVEELRDQLAALQQQTRDAQAQHDAQVEALNTQLQLAQAAQGQATMADLANVDDSEPAAGWDVANDGYVVLASAITLRTGKERENSRRFVRGARVNLIDGVNNDQIDRLRQLKAIAPNDGRVKRATTARVAALAAGAAMDEVAQTPIVAYAPVPLPGAAEAAAAQRASDANGGNQPETQEPDPNLQPTS